MERSGTQAIDRALGLLRVVRDRRERPRDHRPRRGDGPQPQHHPPTREGPGRRRAWWPRIPRPSATTSGPAWSRSAAAPRPGSASTVGRDARGRSPRATGESASLGTRVGPHVLIAAHVPSSQALRFDAGVGSRVPIHASAMGKMLLAMADDPAAEVAALGRARAVHRPHARRARRARRRPRDDPAPRLVAERRRASRRRASGGRADSRLGRAPAVGRRRAGTRGAAHRRSPGGRRRRAPRRRGLTPLSAWAVRPGR